MDEFLDLVVSEMKRQNISMSELSRRSGYTRPYLHRVLNNKEHSPTFELAESVASVLGIAFTATAKKSLQTDR